MTDQITSYYERLTTSKSEPDYVLLRANQNQITSYCEQIRPDRVLLQVDHDHITSMSQTNHEDVTSVLLRTDHEHVVSDHAQIMTVHLFLSKHKYVSRPGHKHVTNKTEVDVLSRADLAVIPYICSSC